MNSVKLTTRMTCDMMKIYTNFSGFKIEATRFIFSDCEPSQTDTPDFPPAHLFPESGSYRNRN